MSTEKMKDIAYRKSVFATLFNTDSGKLVLEYLTEAFEIKNVDTRNQNEVYLQLGKQQALLQIKNLAKGE